MERGALEQLIVEGLSLRAMADRLGVSYTTVRYWMRRHGLATPRAQRLAQTAEARAAGAETCEATCDVHGPMRFIRRGPGGFRCPRCRSEAVSERRRRIKRLLVAEHGGACVRCGYARSIAALHFHHVDRATKSFAVAGRGITRSLEAARAEVAKCVLLCANCHAEVEAEPSSGRYLLL
jgi:transcriptional regulator with XRE-family HTH domain